MFNFFQSNSGAHLKRATMLLQEAHMARIEHQAAAEHHAALAQMYAERAKRLELEVYPPRHHSQEGGIDKVSDERASVYSLDGGRRPLASAA